MTSRSSYDDTELKEQSVAEASRVISPESSATEGSASSPGSVYRNGDRNSIEPTKETSDTIEESGDGTTSLDQHLHGSKLIICILALFVCMFLAALDNTIVATLVLEVGKKFDAFSRIGWITSGYLLPAAVLAPSWGKISIIFGRKYTILVAIVLFEVGSVVCGSATSMNNLIGGRVLAGIGGGGIQILVMIIISEIVPVQKRGKTQGLIGAAFGIASIVGPLVGGAFTTHVSWRWCFYINLPIGGIALVFLIFAFNPPPAQGSIREKLKMVDYLGTFLMTVGLVLVLLGLTFGGDQQFPWKSAAVICCFVIGGIFTSIFCLYNFGYSKKPLIPFAVVKVIGVLAGFVDMFFTFSSFMAGVVYLSVYFQVVRNADAMHAGIDLLPWILATVIASISVGILISKTRYAKPFAIAGTVFCCVGFGLLTTFDIDPSSSKQIGYLIIPGIGVGLQMQSIFISSQVAAPKTNGGVILATSFIGFGRALGGTIGTVIGQLLLNVTLESKIDSHSDELPSEASASMIVNDPSHIRDFPPAIQQILLSLYVDAYRNVMWFGLAGCFMSFIFSLLLSNKRVPKSDPSEGSAKKNPSSDNEKMPSTENNSQTQEEIPQEN